jgi:rod shape determining protein RodA
VFNIDRRVINHFDFTLPLLLLPLFIVSHLLISQTNEVLAQRQSVHFMIGFVVYIFVFFFPVRKYSNFIEPLYWFGVLLLVLVEFVGVTKLGATRWLTIPFTHFTIQPSELIKPLFLMVLAHKITQKPPEDDGYELKDFLRLSVYILVPFILIAKEPDLGTALVLLLVGYGILFIIGVQWKIWATILITIAISSPLVYTHLIKDYQKKRIHDFMSEKPSYHVQQSIIAIGSGGINGQTAEASTQTQLKFLPIATSDFIFAYLVESYGFVGGTGLILLYLIIIYHLLSFNIFLEKNYFIRVFANGIALLLFFNVAVNIAMVIGYAPVVGLPLPMFSYGGSSLINYIVLFALLENIVTFRFLYKYYDRSM